MQEWQEESFSEGVFLENIIRRLAMDFGMVKGTR